MSRYLEEGEALPLGWGAVVFFIVMISFVVFSIYSISTQPPGTINEPNCLSKYSRTTIKNVPAGCYKYFVKEQE